MRFQIPSTRRRRSDPTLLAVALGLLAALGCVGCLGGPEQPASPCEPGADFESLLVVMIDTLRSDHLPAYGYRREVAPFLSRLAAEGIRLQGYSASSWTRSSIATLLTGLHPQRHRAVGRDDALPGATPYLPEILAERGFDTRAYVTNANVGSQFGFARGYAAIEENAGPGKPRAARVAAETLALSEGLSDPFYLYVHLIDPHDPYVPRAPWGRAEGEVDPASYRQPQEFTRDRSGLDEDALSRMRDQYDGEIFEMDQALEEMFEALSARGLLEDTLVVVTSDHGEEFGEHGSVAHGQTLFEEVVQVPFILWAEDGLEGYASEAAFHQVDFLPTVLDALGLCPPPDLDGRSRWPEVRERGLGGEGELLFHLELDHHRALALRSGPLKVVERNEDPARLGFDLAEDPGEQRPATELRGGYGELADHLRREHRRLERRRYEAVEAVATGEAREQLVALGYLDPGSGVDPPPLPDMAFSAAPTATDLSDSIDLRNESRQLLDGWVFADRNGRWSGPWARVALPLGPSSRDLRLVGHAAERRSLVRCRISLDGIELEKTTVAPGPFELRLEIPEALRSAGVGYLDLEVAPALEVPGIPEPVGLHWSRIEVLSR